MFTFTDREHSQNKKTRKFDMTPQECLEILQKTGLAGRYGVGVLNGQLGLLPRE